MNFWQPSGSRGFRVVSPGAPFFFKLKKPYYAIAGFGYFACSSILPAWLAWESFGSKNGAPDFETMRRRIEKYRRDSHTNPRADYSIGCLMISQPVFFDRDQWIDQPSDWARQTMQGASYDLTSGEGLRVWQRCLAHEEGAKQQVSSSGESEPRYGSAILVRPRLGQGIFRIAVTDAYSRACALTEEHSLPVLEAAHIRPYAQGGGHDVSNGLLLRSDLHRLFDRGYVTVTPDLRFEVSRRLKDDFENGKTYYPLHGARIRVPKSPQEQPAETQLEWHSRNVYLG